MLKRFLPKALLLSLVITTSAFADDCQTMDKSLAQSLDLMEKNSPYIYNENEQEAKKQEQIFDQASGDFLAKFNTAMANPISLNCPFTASQGVGLTVKTSPDKHFRAYSWDNYTGGTMHEYSSVLQYQDSDGNVHHSDLEGIAYVADIFQMPIGNKALYMLTSVSVQSTAMRGQDLTLYQVEQGKLISPKLIKTKSGFTNNLVYEYTAIDEIDSDFHFNPATKVLDFPVVVPEKGYINGRVTAKRLKYGFDGKYFVKK